MVRYESLPSTMLMRGRFIAEVSSRKIIEAFALAIFMRISPWDEVRLMPAGLPVFIVVVKLAIFMPCELARSRLCRQMEASLD